MDDAYKGDLLNEQIITHPPISEVSDIILHYSRGFVKKKLINHSYLRGFMKKNDVITLEITGFTAEGNGVGRHEGMAVFVPLTAAGDIARVLIVKVKKSFAYGKLLELVRKAESRIESDCAVFSRCGGCALRHISYGAECEVKRSRVEECIRRIGGIPLESRPIIAAENITRYRNKAQYPISANGEVGFYAIHSHRIIPCSDCALQPEVFSKIAEIVGEWIRKFNITVYDETAKKGLLRHLYLRKGMALNETMAVLVINGDSIPHSQALVDSLTQQLGDELKSIQININREDTNVILGEQCSVLYGAPYIHDILCGVKIRLSPLSFYQVNRDMAQKLYMKAAEYALPDGRVILDLYCGAGTIGLSMARRAKKIIGVEIVAPAIEDAKLNAEQNGITNAEFICADAADAAQMLAKKEIHPDTVIVDPPRKGCSAELLNTVARDFSPERIVYVSCDPATLARDTALLNDMGYRLVEYTPVDLFPRTHHVETVALFLRDINS